MFTILTFLQFPGRNDQKSPTRTPLHSPKKEINFIFREKKFSFKRFFIFFETLQKNPIHHRFDEKLDSFWVFLEKS